MNDFKEYIDGYCKKLKLISNFLSGSVSFEKFKKKFNEINEFKANNKISRLVKKFILMQRKYIRNKSNFQKNIKKFMTSINEEASVLFCNVVKPSFEFMSAPEKKALIILNKQFHKLIKPVKYKENLSQLINRASKIISSAKNASDMFKKLIVLLRKITNIRCIQLLLVNPNSGKIEVKYYAYVKHLPMYDVAHEGGIIVSSAMSMKPICVNSVFEDKRYDIFDAVIKSELAVPIIFNRKTYGVLNFEDENLNRFSKEFVKTLKEINLLISKKLFTLKDKYSLKIKSVI